MKIKKFKFLDKGLSGVQVSGVDAKVKDNATIFMDMEIKYKVPIPKEIIDKVQQLKFAFLMLTGIMPDKGMDCFDQDGQCNDLQKSYDKDIYKHVVTLLGKVFITGFFKDDDKIIITGVVKGYDEMKFAVSTSGEYRVLPICTDWEEGMQEIMNESLRMVNEFIDEVKLRTMKPRQYLMDLFGENEEQEARVTALSDEEAEKEMMQKLQDKGYVMFRPEEVMEEIHATNAAIKEDDGEKEHAEAVADIIEKTFGTTTEEVVSETPVPPVTDGLGLPETGENKKQDSTAQIFAESRKPIKMPTGNGKKVDFLAEAELMQAGMGEGVEKETKSIKGKSKKVA